MKANLDQPQPNPSESDAHKIALDFAKQLITLSSGVLALSATFIKDFPQLSGLQLCPPGASRGFCLAPVSFPASRQSPPLSRAGSIPTTTGAGGPARSTLPQANTPSSWESYCLRSSHSQPLSPLAFRQLRPHRCPPQPQPRRDLPRTTSRSWSEGGSRHVPLSRSG